MQQTQTNRLAVLRATLAAATKACPHIKVVEHFDKVVDEEGLSSFIDKDKAHAGLAEECPYGCQGTGRVARFPEFRQPCGGCGGKGRQEHLGHSHPCPHCGGSEQGSGLGWRVCAGGMAGALAGLTSSDARQVLIGFAPAMDETDPMPDHDTILVKTLERICEIAGLGVPDAKGALENK